MKLKALCVFVVIVSAVYSQAERLPLRHVTMFNSGVAYFEREGAITDSDQVELRFRREQINDVIKSLVVLDRDGGRVSAVTYDAPDPLERTLRSFAVDLSDNPSLSELLNRLRGATVRVKASARDYEGRVMGVEQQTRKEDDVVFTDHILNLFTKQGIRPVQLDEVQELDVLDEAVNRDFQSALAVLTGQMDQSRKGVRLHFVGEGARRVHVAYMLENPIWRTSYRVVLDDDTLFLQGWGHVENMTDDDWDTVSVSLVSGRPISFIQNLYDPIFVQRPEVKHQLHEDVKPPEYDRALAPAAPMMVRASAPAERRERARFALEDAWGEDDPWAGQVAMAVGEATGELFQYVVDEPVSIPRQSSAMLPIVQAELRGEPLSIFNEAVQARHPLNGLRMENTSDVFLLQGPITVFEGGLYAGDARMPDMQPGEERYLGYAVDLATEVAVEWERAPQRIVQLKIVRGVLHARRELREMATYRIRSTRDSERVLLIEHPVKPGWDLLEPDEAPERTRDQYRFRMKLEPDAARKFPVVQRRIQEETVALSTLRPDRVEYYVRQQAISPALKEVMQEWMARQTALAELEKSRKGVEQSIQEITKEQDRIRQNMSVVQRPSESFSMWERKLIEQEDTLSRLNAELRALRDEEAEMKRSMNEWMAQLTIE